VVATPIGNLSDITRRAIEVLQSVDLIASEDTRHTGLLLKHYGIATRQTPYHDHNKRKVTPRIIELLLAGQDVAVVSDAGTPGISDPGFYLVRESIRHGIDIVPIPGPSSVMAALVISGLPTDRFSFEGFLPRTSGKMRRRLEELRADTRTLVFFESPHRLVRTLEAMLEVWGNRPAVIGRELTKKFEEVYRFDLSELLRIFQKEAPRGEIVLLVSGCGGSGENGNPVD